MHRLSGHHERNEKQKPPQVFCTPALIADVVEHDSSVPVVRYWNAIIVCCARCDLDDNVLTSALPLTLDLRLNIGSM